MQSNRRHENAVVVPITVIKFLNAFLNMPLLFRFLVMRGRLSWRLIVSFFIAGKTICFHHVYGNYSCACKSKARMDGQIGSLSE